MSTQRRISWAVFIVLALCIKILSLYPAAVESVYSTGIYPYFARLQRLLFGWVPFSVGDVLYGLAGVWLIVALVRLVRSLVRREVNRGWLLRALRRLVFTVVVVSVLFNGLWGLNYDRQGIA